MLTEPIHYSGSNIEGTGTSLKLIPIATKNHMIVTCLMVFLSVMFIRAFYPLMVVSRC